MRERIFLARTKFGSSYPEIRKVVGKSAEAHLFEIVAHSLAMYIKAHFIIFGSQS